MADKPTLGEIAKDDHGIYMAESHIAMLLDNPDSVLRARGRDLEIYDELLRDEQVKSTFEQRRNSVTGADTEVIPASESARDKAAAKFIEEQLQAISWDDKCDKMLYGRFYGWAVAECMWRMGPRFVELEDIKVRDRSRFRYDIDHRLMLLTQRNPRGEYMPEQKFWQFCAGSSHDDNPYGLGLAHSIYWPVFFKRNGIKFWLIFLEKFGMPTAKGTLPPGKEDDPRERQKALRALRAIQADSAVVVPEGMEIELIEAARSGTADYDGLCDRMDKAISKGVIGQTMTTDDGSSRSQAEVHKDVASDIAKADSDLLCGSFTDQVVRWLIDWNFPGAGYPHVWRKVEPPEDLVQRAERDAKIIELGFEPTEEYVEQTYGPGWKKKEMPALPARGDGLGPMGPEFAELNELARKRIDHRGDQDSLIDAAEALATQYRDLYGSRLEQLLNYLEESKDIETFQHHLRDMLAEPPAPEAVETVQKARLFSRLMGLFRGQR